MAKQKSTKARMLSLEILLEVMPGKNLTPNVKSNLLIRNVVEKFDYLDYRDKALIKRLTEGCIERKITLDYVIDQYSKTKTDRCKPVILNILRMGVYQILFLDNIPDSAACNEAVNLTIDKGFQGLKGFVNGVLRTISREKEKINWPSKKDGMKYYCVNYSMPEWLVEKCLLQFGEECAEQIFAAAQETNRVTLRHDTLLTVDEVQELKKEIEESGVVIEEHPYLPYAFGVKNVDGIAALPGYYEGKIAVQDISSMLAVEIAGIKPGDHVLDVCAAPGGKSMLALEKIGEDGTLEARDLSPAKTSFIEENAQRLHPEKLEKGQLKITEWDARIPDESLVETMDVVLADLPCSGLGVMGHKADIRYHIYEEQIKELSDLQKEILKTVSSYIKPGGILLYSTCTITKEENENNRNFILENLPMEAVSIEESLPEELQGLTGKDGYLQLLPGIHKSDGFFISKFRKKAD